MNGKGLTPMLERALADILVNQAFFEAFGLTWSDWQRMTAQQKREEKKREKGKKISAGKTGEVVAGVS